MHHAPPPFPSACLLLRRSALRCLHSMDHPAAGHTGTRGAFPQAAVHSAVHHAVRCYYGSQNGHDAFPQAAVHSAVHHAVRCYGPSPCGSRHGHDEFPQAAIHSLGGTSCSTLLCTAALWQPARTRRVSAGCDQGAGYVEDGGRGGGGAKGDLLACKVGGGGIIRRAWRVAWQHTQEGGGVAH